MTKLPPDTPATTSLPHTSPNRTARFRPLAIVLVLGCGIALLAFAAPARAGEKNAPLGMKRLSADAPVALRADEKKEEKKEEAEDGKEKKKVPAPELEGGIAWLNTGGPLTLKKDLKGKVVILDFWTLCCINC